LSPQSTRPLADWDSRAKRRRRFTHFPAEQFGDLVVILRCQPHGISEMRKLAITAAALALSTGFALAQGSGAAGDIGGGNVRAGSPPPAVEQGTVGQSGASQTVAPAPKTAKKTAKKKSEPQQ
jgi:hypothetical protein